MDGSHVCVPNSVMYVLICFYVTRLRLSANNQTNDMSISQFYLLGSCNMFALCGVVVVACVVAHTCVHDHKLKRSFAAFLRKIGGERIPFWGQVR